MLWILALSLSLAAGPPDRAAEATHHCSWGSDANQYLLDGATVTDPLTTTFNRFYRTDAVFYGEDITAQVAPEFQFVPTIQRDSHSWSPNPPARMWPQPPPSPSRISTHRF